MSKISSAETTREEILKVLMSLQWLMETHDGHLELGEIDGDKIYIHCSGECISCDTKCIQEAIAVKWPHLKVTCC